MTFPVLLVVNTNDKSSQGVKTASGIVTVVYFILFVLAIYLAARDMQFLPNTSTKVWVLLLAFFLPDLYVLLHGISSSAQGAGFFSGSPMPGVGASTLMSTLSPGSLGPSTLGLE